MKRKHILGQCALAAVAALSTGLLPYQVLAAGPDDGVVKAMLFIPGRDPVVLDPATPPIGGAAGTIESLPGDGVIKSVAFEPRTPPTGGAAGKVVSPADLRAASVLVIIDDRWYGLDAYVWRDVMPGIGSTDDSLRASVRVVPMDEASPRSSLPIETLWVINEGEIWVTAVGADGFVSGGPAWEPGAHVTLIVQVRDGQGQARLVRTLEETIQRTG